MSGGGGGGLLCRSSSCSFLGRHSECCEVSKDVSMDRATVDLEDRVERLESKWLRVENGDAAQRCAGGGNALFM